eukprot:scaffold5838_cov106-Skeletonema_dohrnii-CCMP3373.AAC.5
MKIQDLNQRDRHKMIIERTYFLEYRSHRVICAQHHECLGVPATCGTEIDRNGKVLGGHQVR